MSLFSALQIGNSGLFAAQVGLQVTGNNIANANTPGYIRERAVFSPAPTQRIGTLPLGMGVEVQAIVQEVDRNLEERLRGAASDVASAQAQENAYLQLESLIGELRDTDLSTSLNHFFNAIHEVVNQPEDVSLRRFAVLQGQLLVDDIQRLDGRTVELALQVDHEIALAADEINRRLEQVASLNEKIILTEAGAAGGSDAVGLRDRRGVLLAELAEWMDIRTAEQEDGSVNVFVGGEYLVTGGEYRRVVAVREGDDPPATSVRLQDTDSELRVSSGKLAGLYTARDEIFGGFRQSLQDWTESLIWEFNRLYSQGQGMAGLESITSELAVEDTSLALDEASLPFSPEHGSFEVLVHNHLNDTTETTQIPITLNGLAGDTTTADLVAQLDAIDGINASTNSAGRIEIAADSEDYSFAFANDTSGVLAALGLNVFFTGSDSSDIGVSQSLVADPAKFAASLNGPGIDQQNAIRLAELLNQPVESSDGESLVGQYESFTAAVAEASAATQAVSQGFQIFHSSLEGQHLSISGVSIDDEAVKMLSYQRAYQAAARYIATINELLEVLVNL